MEKLLKEFRKLSIEESNSFYVKSLTKIRTLLLNQLVVSRRNLLREQLHNNSQKTAISGY
jgi:hypothetical protein